MDNDDCKRTSNFASKVLISQQGDESVKVVKEIEPATYLFRSALIAPANTPSVFPFADRTAYCYPDIYTEIKRSFECKNQNRSVEYSTSKWSPEGTVDVGEGCSWKNPVLKRIGKFNQVSRYHVEVDQTQFDRVRDALVEMFRVNSLQIKYQDSPFTSARCRACLEKLEFNIIIWQSREENKILIEVDRISGDSIPFHTKYANLVLKTVEDCCSGNKSYSPEPTQIQDPITRGTSERDKIQLEQTSSILNRCKGEQAYIEFVGKENPMVSAIEIVADMLCAARYDSRGLALESLLHLTDPYLSDLETVKAVSKVILLGTAPGFVDNDVQICRIIQERVVYLAVTGLCFDGVYAEDELQDHAFCALNILAQAINNDDTASDLTAFVSYSRTIISGQGRTNVVDGLLRMVSCANSAPHRAYLAAHILEVLCRRITEVNSQIQPHAGDIQRAHRIGTMSHAGLEQASKRLLDAMCVC